jgi:hypothetical protein
MEMPLFIDATAEPKHRTAITLRPSAQREGGTERGAPNTTNARGGGQGRANKHSSQRRTLRHCSIPGVSRVATYEHFGRIGCFLWLLSLQQQRK